MNALGPRFCYFLKCKCNKKCLIWSNIDNVDNVHFACTVAWFVVVPTFLPWFLSTSPDVTASISQWAHCDSAFLTTFLTMHSRFWRENKNRRFSILVSWHTRTEFFPGLFMLWTRLWNWFILWNWFMETIIRDLRSWSSSVYCTRKYWLCCDF